MKQGIIFMTMGSRTRMPQTRLIFEIQYTSNFFLSYHYGFHKIDLRFSSCTRLRGNSI